MRTALVIYTILLSLTGRASGMPDLTEEEKRWIQENPVVKFGYDPEWKPLEFINSSGDHDGIAAEFLRIIQEKTGLTFQPLPEVTWAQSVDSVKSGAADVLLCLAQNNERDLFLNFTQTYISYPFVIVTQKEGDFIGSLEDLKGKTVAVPKGYAITEKLKAEYPSISLIYTQDIESALMYVSIDKADATVGNLGVLSYYLNYEGYQTLKIAADTELPKLNLKIGVGKDLVVLHSILDKTLSTISQTERMAILEKWGKVTYDHGVDMARVWRIALISVAAVMLIIAMIVVWNRTLRKEIKLRKVAETKLQNSLSQIQDQKAIIEIKNQEVTDSIKYAKRIQTAILPPKQSFEDAFKSSFVLYKPKDIVAGDFYWLQDKGDVVLFAAADCTGHGVPGAMVSVVCSNALNKVVNELEIYDPGRLLDEAREIVIERFEGSENEIKDGMDISLAVYHKKDKKLKWAGAYNPLWLVRETSDKIGSKSKSSYDTTGSVETNEYLNEQKGLENSHTQPIEIKAEFPAQTLDRVRIEVQDDFVLIEVKADKQPIGKCDHQSPFTTHEIEIQDGDKLYLFTDGFADQFGGDKGKKIRSKTMRNLIAKYSTLTMSEQMKQLNLFVDEWMGDLEQLDDICVIGVEL